MGIIFKIGRPYSTVRLKKGKNIHLDLDADDFLKAVNILVI